MSCNLDNSYTSNMALLYSPCHAWTKSYINAGCWSLFPFWHMFSYFFLILWMSLCVFSGERKRSIRNSRLPLRSSIWQLVEHDIPTLFLQKNQSCSKWNGLGNPWPMANSSSSIKHQLQQRFGCNPTAAPAASDQVVDSHEGEFHHGTDGRIDLALAGSEVHPRCFFNAGNGGKDQFPNEWLKAAIFTGYRPEESCSTPQFPQVSRDLWVEFQRFQPVPTSPPPWKKTASTASTGGCPGKPHK